VRKYGRIFVPQRLSVLSSKQFSKGIAQGKLSFEEQIMSTKKYPNKFSKSDGGYCVYYPVTKSIILYCDWLPERARTLKAPSFPFGIACYVPQENFLEAKAVAI